MDEVTARKKHISGEPYVALIGSTSTPLCFIEVIPNKEMIGVGFLDQQQREYLTYQFQTKTDNQIFLNMATHREFETDTNKVTNGTCYIFSEDGNVIIRKEKFSPHIVEEATSKFEARNNYEKYPSFGDYSRLIVADR
jgi:hypothetical protein